MSISIIRPKNKEEINFDEYSDNESISSWVTFEFKITKDIDKTGLLFSFATDKEDFYFQNRNGSNVEIFRFGSQKPIKANSILKRRVRFYTPNSVDKINSMNFFITLYSDLEEELFEDDIRLKVKKTENGI